MPDDPLDTDPQAAAQPAPVLPPAPDPSLEPSPTGDPSLTPAPPAAPAPTMEDRMAQLEADGLRAATEAKEREQAQAVQIARLEGRLEAGGGQQPVQFAYQTEGEYRLKAQLMEAQAAGLEQEDPRLLVLQQERSGLQQNYNHFLGHQQQEATAAQNRRMDLQLFFGRRQMDPRSEHAQMVEALYDRGLPLERIEAEVLEPTEELKKLRGVAGAQAAGSAAMAAATTIEGGTVHNQPPPPVSHIVRTPDQAASDDLARRMEQKDPDIEGQLFGDIDFGGA